MATRPNNDIVATPEPGPVAVAPPAPVRRLDAAVLRNLGQKYKSMFDRFAQERLPAEQRWLRNLRQLLGIYDPEIERALPPNRSRAYPRLTRMKCVSLLSRIMNLMHPGNEDNWELKASPSPEMSPEAVAQAVSEAMARRQAAGQPAELSQAVIDDAVRALADSQAARLSLLIKDQMQELGGDQSLDWIGLNRKICQSGIHFGLGVLEGPFIRTVQQSGWMASAEQAEGAPPGTGQFKPVTRTIYKPQFDFLPVWDFYPDMSAKRLPGEGYFVRKVMGRAALRRLADRQDFFGSQIKQVLLQMPGGNYKMKTWEQDLKTMGSAAQTQQNSWSQSGRDKYEIIVWKGPVSAQTLRDAGAEVPDRFLADDIDAELWLVDNWVIKAEINAWRKLGVDVKCVHLFPFDEDDTSPIGPGLPQIMRDSALAVAAVARMALDNASITCGPNLEVNTELMRTDQDLGSVMPYKLWYRNDSDAMTAQFPAVRQIPIDGHLDKLIALMKTFLDFAEMETFIGPSTGGDMTQVPSEGMRTMAGASMIQGNAALPFKDIVRNYDTFTQSVVQSMVGFNRVYNPDEAPKGDYNVVARGATSLVAKEVRGVQIDMLSQTLTPEERDHVDERKFVEAKFASRDLQSMLVSPSEAEHRKAARAQQMAEQQAKADQMLEAQTREVLSGAFKNITQGQKNATAADAASVKTALDVLETTGNDNQGTNPQAGS